MSGFNIALIAFVTTMVLSRNNHLNKNLKEILEEAKKMPKVFKRDSPHIKILTVYDSVEQNENEIIHNINFNQKGAPKTLKISVKASNKREFINGKDIELIKYNRQIEVWNKIGDKDANKSLLKYDFTGEEIIEDKIYYFILHEPINQNFNNYLKQNKKSLIEKVTFMKEMAEALSILHIKGEQSCNLNIKKYIVTGNSPLKIWHLGLADKNGICYSNSGEAQEPMVLSREYHKPKDPESLKFTQDIYSLAVSYIALIDQNMDKAYQFNINIINSKEKDNKLMIGYANNIFKFLINDLNLKIRLGNQENNSTDILSEFITERLHELIIGMLKTDLKDRLTIFDVVRFFTILSGTIHESRSNVQSDLDSESLKKIFKEKELLVGPVYDEQGEQGKPENLKGFSFFSMNILESSTNGQHLIL